MSHPPRASRLATLKRIHPVFFTVLAVIVLSYQYVALHSTLTGVYGVPLIPTWNYIFDHSLLSLSQTWPGGFGAGSTDMGAPETLRGALLGIAYSALHTWGRVIIGLFMGGVAGIGLGLLMGYSRNVRRLVAFSADFLRMMPLLAMIPLFGFWFGMDNFGAVLFIVYGVFVLLFAMTVSAVENVPRKYVDYAATLGASRLHIYRTVVAPAIFPELRTGVLVAFGLAWSCVLGAEYLGVQVGLGRIVVYAQSFTNTGVMLLVAVLFVLFAFVTSVPVIVLSNRLTRWMP